jgi:hypothetical protein
MNIGATKNKGGRPRKNISEEQMAQVEALAAYMGQDHIADYLGMDRDTLKEVFKRQPEVFRRYKAGKSKAIAAVAQSLIKKARDGDTASAIFFLKTQAGWKETSQVDVNLQKIPTLQDLYGGGDAES